MEKERLGNGEMVKGNEEGREKGKRNEEKERKGRGRKWFIS